MCSLPEEALTKGHPTLSQALSLPRSHTKHPYLQGKESLFLPNHARSLHQIQHVCVYEESYTHILSMCHEGQHVGHALTFWICVCVCLRPCMRTYSNLSHRHTIVHSTLAFICRSLKNQVVIQRFHVHVCLCLCLYVCLCLCLCLCLCVFLCAVCLTLSLSVSLSLSLSLSLSICIYLYTHVCISRIVKYQDGRR